MRIRLFFPADSIETSVLTGKPLRYLGFQDSQRQCAVLQDFVVEGNQTELLAEGLESGKNCPYTVSFHGFRYLGRSS
jgi:hypothetical protein